MMQRVVLVRVNVHLLTLSIGLASGLADSHVSLFLPELWNNNQLAIVHYAEVWCYLTLLQALRAGVV